MFLTVLMISGYCVRRLLMRQVLVRLLRLVRLRVRYGLLGVLVVPRRRCWLVLVSSGRLSRVRSLIRIG